MRTLALLAGGGMMLAGLVWLAQGLNLPFAPRSFMTADRIWILIGSTVTVAGILVIGLARRSR